MLIAYLDESVDGKGTEVFAMAGLLGDSTQWEVFEAKWKAVLRKFKIKEFKASACEYQQREFRDWTEDKCVSLQNDLIAVIDEVQPTGITTAINLADCKSLDPGLPGQENTANLILDYGPGGTKVFRARGLLAEPVAISRSALSAVVTFIKEGVRHILDGLDHVLFVVGHCNF